MKVQISRFLVFTLKVGSLINGAMWVSQPGKVKAKCLIFADFEKETVTLNRDIWDWRKFGAFAHKSHSFVNFRKRTFTEKTGSILINVHARRVKENAI